MEIFIDAGIFEILLATGFAAIINFIYRHKVLLILYAALLIILPMLLLVTSNKELLYVIIAFVVVNNIMFAFLLLREHKRHPGMPLFSLRKK